MTHAHHTKLVRFKERPQCGLLLENARGEVLLQLRDDNPSIPYPNCWGTFGGQVEDGEQPEAAIVREIAEELDYGLHKPESYATFPCDGYQIHMFRTVDHDLRLESLRVREGQRAGFFSCADLNEARLAFNCREILEDYFKRFHRQVPVCIGLGSNLGDRQANLLEALQQIGGLMYIEATSSVYETEPVEHENQGWFLNMALQGSTQLFPEVLLEKLRDIESALGRQRHLPKGPRTIDLDILLYGDAVIATQRLTVPHPAMHERAFVLEPLAEIAPGLMHPLLRKSMAALRDEVAGGKKVLKKSFLTGR